jgi:molybdopterin molybdotransferase
VKKLFHQVNQRPGKPFWFGVSENGKTVFALPGNPVSTYMCFYRYIKPWILKSLRVTVPNLSASLATDFSFNPKLTYFLQVAVQAVSGKLVAFPEAGGGSGDFVNLKNVTGFLELPPDKSSFRAGEVFPYFPFRNFL